MIPESPPASEVRRLGSPFRGSTRCPHGAPPSSNPTHSNHHGFAGGLHCRGSDPGFLQPPKQHLRLFPSRSCFFEEAGHLLFKRVPDPPTRWKDFRVKNSEHSGIASSLLKIKYGKLLLSRLTGPEFSGGLSTEVNYKHHTRGPWVPFCEGLSLSGNSLWAEFGMG